MCHGMLQEKKREQTIMQTPVILEKFDKNFLKEQQREQAKDVKKMSSAERMTYGLPYATEIEAVAPLDQEEMRNMSRQERKAHKKQHNERVAARNAAMKQEQQKEQEQIRRRHRTEKAVEDMLKEDGLIEYAERTDRAIRLNPNYYVGGEDDVSNTTILNEMERIPQAFGLAVKDSAEAAGYTIENMRSLKEFNSRIRYQKWRMRNALDLLIPYTRECMNNPNLSDEQFDQVSAQLEMLSSYVDRMTDEIRVMERAFQLSMAELLNHKNFKVPAETTASVKKRNYNLETYHGLQASYATAKEEQKVNILYDELLKDMGPKMTIEKELRTEALEIAQAVITDKKVLHFIEENTFTPEAVNMLKKAMEENPPPQDPALTKEYEKQLMTYCYALRGYSTVCITYEAKILLQKNHADMFQDPESGVYQKHQRSIESERKLVVEAQTKTLPEAVEMLTKVSRGEAASE